MVFNTIDKTLSERCNYVKWIFLLQSTYEENDLANMTFDSVVEIGRICESKKQTAVIVTGL